MSLFLQFDSYRRAVVCGVFSDAGAVAFDAYMEFFPGALHDDVVRPFRTGVHPTQSHLVPCVGQLWCERERAESRRSESEHAFGDDAAVESALSREVALIALGPRFDGIRHMFAEEPGLRVEPQAFGGLFAEACGINASQGIERGAVPERVASGCGQHSVFGPELRGEQGRHGRLPAFENIRDQRNADPRTQDVVALVIAVGGVPFDRRTEEAFDVFTQRFGPAAVFVGQPLRPSGLLGEPCRGAQGVVVER